MVKSKTTQLVKITPKGKLSIRLDGRFKIFFVAMIEKLMGELEYFNAHPLDMKTVEGKKNFALVSEIYYLHFVQFNMINSPVKLSLTMSQALCLWQMACEYDNAFFADAEMGNLLMQIHQKLS